MSWHPEFKSGSESTATSTITQANRTGAIEKSEIVIFNTHASQDIRIHLSMTDADYTIIAPGQNWTFPWLPEFKISGSGSTTTWKGWILPWN